jgi:hypothetical protein
MSPQWLLLLQCIAEMNTGLVILLHVMVGIAVHVIIQIEVAQTLQLTQNSEAWVQLLLYFKVILWISTVNIIPYPCLSGPMISVLKFDKACHFMLYVNYNFTCKITNTSFSIYNILIHSVATYHITTTVCCKDIRTCSLMPVVHDDVHPA